MADSKLVSEVALSALASDIKAALALKANQATTYTKTETDNLLADKADKSDTYTKEETDNEVYNVLPTDTASGSIATFTDGGDNIPVKAFECEIVAQQESGTPTPSSPLPITGFSQADITVTDNDQITNIYTVAFGQTIYGGRLIYANGQWAIEADKAMTLISDLDWSYNSESTRFGSGDLSGIIENAESTSIPLEGLSCECYQVSVAGSSRQVDLSVAVNTTGSILLKDTNYSDVSSLISAVGSYKIVYPLETPVIIPITSSTRVKTIRGLNNIFSNTGDVSLEYRADIGLYIDKKLNP